MAQDWHRALRNDVPACGQRKRHCRYHRRFANAGEQAVALRNWLWLLAALAVLPANAIVIRADIADADYRADDSELPALADLPGEGHGVLIAPHWVLTAAHAVQGQTLREVRIGGKARAVAAVIVHPDFRAAPPELQQGDAAPLLALLKISADIALVRLQQPVNGIAPLVLYRGSDEAGQVARLYGKGASGNGASGQDAAASHRGELRRADNRLLDSDGHWLRLRFDAPPAAEPREGMQGNGDSGGPLLLRRGGRWQVAGLMSWQSWQGDLSGFRGGLYGTTAYAVRVSAFAGWIDATLAADTVQKRRPAR